MKTCLKIAGPFLTATTAAALATSASIPNCISKHQMTLHNLGVLVKQSSLASGMTLIGYYLFNYFIHLNSFQNNQFTQLLKLFSVSVVNTGALFFTATIFQSKTKLDLSKTPIYFAITASLFLISLSLFILISYLEKRNAENNNGLWPIANSPITPTVGWTLPPIPNQIMSPPVERVEENVQLQTNSFDESVHYVPRTPF